MKTIAAVPFWMAGAIALQAAGRTALDRYVAAPDPAYSWRLVDTLGSEQTKTFLLELTSQTWLTTNEVDRPQWKHWLLVARPPEVEHPTALLFIGGGSNEKPAPKGIDENLTRIAVATRSIVAELRNVPNQPLVFANDGEKRVEDSLIAYTWDKFLRTGDARWPARLPMTKSAVRALDTLTAFCAGPEAGGLSVTSFVVAGGSKRGWTTWTTAAVDRRVVAIMPVVIDLLNIEPSFIHHFEAYGFYAPAVDDYTKAGIMEWQGTPEYRRLMKIEEPYEYRDRLKLPKFIINATGDQFFLPDSSQFYFDDLPGVKYLRYVPNADHSLKETDAFETLATCYAAVLEGSALPRFRWKADRKGTLRVEAETRPTAVKLWQAHNPDARDFRLDTLGKAWKCTDLPVTEDGIYVVRAEKPAKGWTAFLVELTFPHPGGPAPFKFTTGVQVVPEAKPFRFKPSKAPRR